MFWPPTKLCARHLNWCDCGEERYWDWLQWKGWQMRPQTHRSFIFVQLATSLSTMVCKVLFDSMVLISLSALAARSRDRHLRYCNHHSHTRIRPRSCRACGAAKTKCTFGTPCARCVRKGCECVYELGPRARQEPSGQSNLTPSFGASTTDDGFLPDREFGTVAAYDLDMNFNHRNAFLVENKDQPTDLFLNELFAFEDASFGQPPSSTDLASCSQYDIDLHPTSWCAWIRRGASLALIAEKSPARLDSSFSAVIFQSGLPTAQYNADLIIQAIRAFPTMMTRRETLPWFIHPHSELLFSDGALPNALSNCMSIAQMFVSRTSETKKFLRQSMEAEYRRFVSEVR